LAFGWGQARPRRNRALGVWLFVSLLAFAQVGQKSLWAVLALLIIQAALIAVNDRTRIFKFALFPLFYAAVLLILHAQAKWNIPGFSYLVLSSSLDLWMRLNPEKSLPNENLRPGVPSWKDRAVNLLSFPKLAVGPITSVKDHWDPPPATEKIFRVIFFGVLKAFIGVNLWRQFVPAPAWAELHSPLEFFWFGLWNYVHLFLEFSGTCDLVAAAFWLFGFGCPLNFEKPYVALSVSEFWKRWHVTLGRWIRNHVFIAFGGSRVAKPRIYLNLFLAMVLSGLWHGLSWNYLAWGAMQGVLLVFERAISLEKRLTTMPAGGKFLCWLATQFLVTCSWIVFFGKF
jgi:D-alanyl-lipoteichoic acid acyltransferase DltB (MBOAT superfamily)